eukprot:TRINITY_DN14216_c0_g1_i1.p1 TRINITY_DN14216_c0_g1~~TRINITY_DN14216_c0_g1_i1.p1  ORF type:complete len:308 (-),score=148.91 TRINITY_DN14216_c0_g1_i1:104-1027(-)
MAASLQHGAHEMRPARKVIETGQKRQENPIVFLEISIGGAAVGRITLELYADRCPRTAENFRRLCTGEARSKATGARLCYVNCVFHRVIKDFIAQGGDITHFNGTGGESIFGPKFEDENFYYRHNEPGTLSMANAGPNTNNSQFFITLKTQPHLDRKHVAFGRVMQGMAVMREVEKVPCDREDYPMTPIVIAKCGQVNKGVKVDLPEEKKVEEILSTEVEQALREKSRQEAERGELTWFDKQRKVMEQGYREKLEHLDETERKVRLMNKRKQKVVGAGDRPDDEEAEAEDRVKQEKGIVKKRRTLFF